MSEQVVEAVRELLPVLRERAQETEDARRVSEESIKGLRQAGFFRLLQPGRYGGLEAHPVEFYRAVRLIAGGRVHSDPGNPRAVIVEESDGND